ncbi:MAG: hypothetical protein IJH50_09140 [Kiritimatiellae bacterium]|nr:hypothetical protein [Kiritimatiellia bacterium]
MEVWRVEDLEGQRPKVLGTSSFVLALCLHIAFFLVCWAAAKWHFREKEVITPIDLTVVVVENLDGNPDEPPPLKKPDPPPPPPPPPPPKPPKPKPKPKEPEKPKELEKIVTNIVEKVEKKKEPDPPKPPEPPKKELPKPPEPPKKTAKELREERIKRMQQSAKDTKRRVESAKPSPPQPNGRTDKKTLSDAEIQKLLNAGYKPGSSTNLAASEEQLCYSLIKQAFEAKWDVPPWTDTLKPISIRVWFGNGGSILKYKLVSSSSDRSVDATITSAASRVGAVRGLTAGFIEKYGKNGVVIQFEVKPK